MDCERCTELGGILEEALEAKVPYYIRERLVRVMRFGDPEAAAARFRQVRPHCLWLPLHGVLPTGSMVKIGDMGSPDYLVLMGNGSEAWPTGDTRYRQFVPPKASERPGTTLG